MPTTTYNGRTIGYETAGEGLTVAFVPTLGFGPWQWSWQVPAVAGPFEAVAIEPWGTGRSDPPSGAPSVAELAGDLEAVLRDADASEAHLVGVGLGGHVALEYAAHYGRARSLALVGTTLGQPEAEPPDGVVEALSAPRDDPAALRRSLEAVLSPDFVEGQPDVLEGILGWRSEEDAERPTWEALAPAFEDWDRDWPPYEVTEPALVVQGGVDAVVPPANGELLAGELPKGELLDFPEAGHLVTVERSRPLNDRLLGFLEEHAEHE